MKKFIIYTIATMLLLAIAGCASSRQSTNSPAEETERLTIASETRDCTGVGPQQCLLIKREGSKEWEYWYSGIQGFDYVAGYEYVLTVRKVYITNPAADRSSFMYNLVNVESVTEKKSAGMPPRSWEF